VLPNAEKVGSGAPSHARSVTASQLKQWDVLYLGDLSLRNGRGICGDVLVDEVPAQFNKTKPTQGDLSSRTSRPDRCAATLIWTK
jgi:hypothetical protein